MNNEDLNSVVELIDIVAQRGAFKGEELEAVGKLRNKIVKHIFSENKVESNENTGD